jgi:microcystin-dependent protein
MGCVGRVLTIASNQDLLTLLGSTDGGAAEIKHISHRLPCPNSAAGCLTDQAFTLT